jgi:hypothetical protein
MSELSHFEELSAKTPVKQPYAILGGAVLLIIVLWLLNAIAPNEAVKESKSRESDQVEEAASPAQQADEDEI